MFTSVGVLCSIRTATVKFTKMGLINCCHTQNSAGCWVMTKRSAAQNLIRSEHLLNVTGSGCELGTEYDVLGTFLPQHWDMLKANIAHYYSPSRGNTEGLHNTSSRLRTVLHNIHAGTVCAASNNRLFSTVIPADWNVTHINFRSAKFFPLAKWHSVMDKRWPRMTASRMYLATVEVTLSSIPSHDGPSNRTNNFVIVCLTHN